MNDWNTLKKTERTDSPSRVFLLRQNCTSGVCVCVCVGMHVK